MGEICDETFTFQWKVSDLSPLDNGSKIVSDAFQGGPVSQHHWKLEVAKTAKYPNVVVVYLLLVQFGDNDVSDSRGVKVSASVGVSNEHGSNVHILQGKHTHRFRANALRMIVEKFFRASATSLSISCEVSIVDNYCDMTEDFSFTDRTELKRLMSLSRLMDTMMDDTDFADLVINSGDGKTFHVHKSILAARSNVFKTMLKSNLVETLDSTVNIVDFNGETIKAMIEYIYKGDTPSLHEKAIELIMLAEKYELMDLKKDCENSIVKNLDETTFIQVITIASKISSVKLKPASVAYFTRNKATLLKLHSVKEFFRKYPSSLLDILS